MADNSIPPAPVAVQVLTEKSEGGRWFYDGRWWTPGNIREDGVIVGTQGQFITAGIVWIDARNAETAAAHGWIANGERAQDGNLVQVARA